MIDVPYTLHCTCRFQTASDVASLSPTTHEEIIRLLEKNG